MRSTTTGTGLPLLDGVEGYCGSLRVLGTALPPPHLQTRSGPRHRDHQHQRRVLQCEPPCERTHFILKFPSSPPPALRVTARAAHLDLLEGKKPKELIGQKWGWRQWWLAGQQWPDRGGMCTSTARATVCPKSEGSAASGGKQSRRPAFHYLHPSAAAIFAPVAPSYLPHCCAEKLDAATPLLCHQLRTCRSVLPQQQGYSRDVRKHLGVYANLINKGCSCLPWKT